jgi:hypothetical protein
MLVFRAGPTKATKAKTPSKTDGSNETDASRRKRKQLDGTGRKQQNGSKENGRKCKRNRPQGVRHVDASADATSKTNARQTDASGCTWAGGDAPHSSQR